MNIFKKIIFKIVKSCLRKADEYRASYYEYVGEDKIELGDSVSLGSGSAIVIFSANEQAKAVIKAKNHFRRNCMIALAEGGLLKIGEDNFFNNGCSITCMNSVEIGIGNLFGEDVKIYDHNHIYTKIEVPIRKQGFSMKPITIGNNCWIGSNCIILGGVAIGDNVVIGANNLIYKSIPSNSIIKAISSFDLKFRQ